LYKLGFSHNNCGGFCVKAGQGQFKLLQETMPERYAFHENMEEKLRQFLGKPVSILRRMVNKVMQRFTLKELREELEAGKKVDETDLGGCGCMLDDYSDEEFEKARECNS